MKKITMKSFISLALILTSFLSHAQLKAKLDCPDLEVDILNGKVNGLKADIPDERVKAVLPCFTSPTEKQASCGTVVAYNDRDLRFYTGRDYIEIGPKFKGKLSMPLMGASGDNLFKWLGNPKLKDDQWAAYQTSYGTMVLHFDESKKVKLIQMSTHGTSTLSLCE